MGRNCRSDCCSRCCGQDSPVDDIQAQFECCLGWRKDTFYQPVHWDYQPSEEELKYADAVETICRHRKAALERSVQILSEMLLAPPITSTKIPF